MYHSFERLSIAYIYNNTIFYTIFYTYMRRDFAFMRSFFFLFLLLLFSFKLLTHSEPLVFKIKATIIPYSPRTSEKIRIKTIPTKSLGWCMYFLTPTSPTIPMA